MVSLFGRGFDSRQLHSNELKFSYKPHAIVEWTPKVRQKLAGFCVYGTTHLMKSRIQRRCWFLHFIFILYVKYVYTEAKKNGLIPNDKIFG